jgi:D-alanine-D-alanine ligase
MAKKNIALVTGGYSKESVISMLSAEVVEQHLDKKLYNVYKIIVSRDRWYYPTGKGGRTITINKHDFSLRSEGETVRFDAVLLMIHGTPGEDGKLQGYFDLLDIPYTSCDAQTSALTFNKRYTVATAAFSGIKVAKSLHFFKNDTIEIAEILKTLTLPVFVKPNNGGSSIGMSKVTSALDLPAAIEKAFKEDDQVLIEEFIRGREFTIGVLKTKGQLIALPITEVTSKKDFFDYEAKYTSGMATEITPAQIEPAKTKLIEELAKRIYQIFNCRGIVRIDFIWNEVDNQPYMLEINTVPGQSQNSLVPQQVRAYGWTMRDFYGRLVEEVTD